MSVAGTFDIDSHVRLAANASKEEETSDVIFRMACRQQRAYTIYSGEGILEPKRSLLPELLRGRKALVVTTPTVARLYGNLCDDLAEYHDLPVKTMILPCSENTKSLELAGEICRAALEYSLDRKGLLIALGGGVCSDLVTRAASMIRRGISHIRIPTTLIGQVDAGVGVKGAVNFDGKKSFLGVFYPPESVIIDPHFLKTLPARHLRYGLAEILKIAVARDAALFRLVADHSERLVRSGFQAPLVCSRRVLRRAAARMLEELQENPYEDQGYRRLVDMGHTFSPAIEAASGYALHHGEAVAIDVAISTTLSLELGLITAAERDEIVAALVKSGLPIYTDLATEDLCLKAMRDATLHRGGAMNLVIPSRIGQAVFLERANDLPLGVLRNTLSRLANEGREKSRKDVFSAHG
jgi:2-epi-5-epi-valiolone synthase